MDNMVTDWVVCLLATRRLGVVSCSVWCLRRALIHVWCSPTHLVDVRIPVVDPKGEVELVRRQPQRHGHHLARHLGLATRGVRNGAPPRGAWHLHRRQGMEIPAAATRQQTLKKAASPHPKHAKPHQSDLST